jgi:hypothetical protein
MSTMFPVESLSPEELARCHEISAGTGAYLLTGAALSRVLGYPSLGALNRAVSRARARGDQALPVFNLPGRRGLFGWAPEISRLISKQRALGPQPGPGAGRQVPHPRTRRDSRKGGVATT